MWEQTVGSSSTAVMNWVERGAVKHFALAIGDLNPLYTDEAAAAASRHGRCIAPPTFPVTFEYGSIDTLRLPTVGLIHGSQEFHFRRPLYVGEAVECSISVKDAFEKKGSLGLMTFIVLERSGNEPGGNVIFTSGSTLIVTEAALKGMSR